MEILIFDAWWLLAVLLLGWLIYLRLTWNHDYWKKRGVPYIEPQLFFGNIKDTMLFRKSIGEVYRDLYWKLDGHRYGGIFHFLSPFLLIRDPELIKDILAREFTSFQNNFVHMSITEDPMFGRNPFIVRGEQWKVTRARLNPAFTSSKLKAMFSRIPDICREFKELFKENDCSGEFEALSLCSRFATDVVTMCSFGVNANCLKNPDSKFRLMGLDIIEPGRIRVLSQTILLVSPSLSKLLGISARFFPKYVTEFFIRLVGEVMSYRLEKNITSNDYIQHLINIKNKTGTDDLDSSEKYPFTDVDVAAQAVTMFFDGAVTSSIVMSLALYSLAYNPDVQTKLRNEVNSVLKEDGGELTYEGIQKMTYLDMVLSEVLRLYNIPLNFFTKECTKPMKLPTPSGKDYTVEKGTPILISLLALHRDPKYFPDPERFNPEHFSEENKKNRHKYVYLAFGEGPRRCIGTRFSMMEMKAGITTVISSFEVSPTSRTPKSIIQNPIRIAFNFKGRIWLKFSPLNGEISN